MEGFNYAGVGNVFQHLAGKITKVPFAFNAQAFSQSVQCFDYNPKCFRYWVIQIKLGNLLAYRFRQIFACQIQCRFKNCFFLLFIFYFCIFYLN